MRKGGLEPVGNRYLKNKKTNQKSSSLGIHTEDFAI